jgi:hypothetical protein
MRPKTYRALVDAIHDGIAGGWYRAHKHTDHPDPQTIKDCIEDGIMLEICERFDLEDEPKEG